MIVSSLASSLRLHQKLSRGIKISKFFYSMHASRYPPPFIDSWICMHAPACENTWLCAMMVFKLVGVSIHFEFVTLLYLILSLSSLHGLCFFAWKGVHAPHQHANSTPPFRKVWLRAWAAYLYGCTCMHAYIMGAFGSNATIILFRT